MYNVLTLLALLLSCYFLIRILRPAGTAESALIFFCLFTAHIVALGYLLSSINQLANVGYWSMLSIIAALISAVAAFWARKYTALPKFEFVSPSNTVTSIKSWYIKETSSFDKLILTPLILTTFLLGILNLAVVLFTAPHNWDGLTYHLARVAYYLQHNNLNSFDADYWAQVIHPKNSSLLHLYTYLVSGRNENLTQLVQFISYWVAVFSVYAISTKAGNSKTESIFAAMISGLLTEWLMEATTAQNDLITTAYFGSIVYFLLAFREMCKSKYLVLAALGIGLAIGTKTSVILSMIPVALVAIYSLFQFRAKLQPQLNHFTVLAASTLLAVCIFALPSGYVENYRIYGNPIGPEEVRTHHSFEGESIEYIARNGTKNIIRFGLEFLSLDGLPTTDSVLNAQTFIRSVPEKIVRRLKWDLDTVEATRVQYNIQKAPIAHEDLSYWGILGFALVWIVVLLSIVGVIKSTDIRILSFAAVLFLLSQAYAGSYDPWRGRYFIIAAIFAVPPVGICLRTKNQLLRAYLFFIVLLGCISAISAVVLRTNGMLVSIDGYQDNGTSIFAMDRLQQLTRNTPEYYEPIKKFDQLVPKDATVAIFLYVDSFEYPLFGEHLSRTILPVNSFDKGLLPIPPDAEYLLYAESFPCANLQEDMHLGADWYLRQLTDQNRSCP